MKTFNELDKPFYLTTPKGTALCWAIIDYGPEMDLLFVCWQEDTGECWTWPSYDIKVYKNISLGRHLDKPKRK